jgi:hypothetical protein
MSRNFSFRKKFNIILNADAEEWYENQTSDISAWMNCKRADWMLCFYYNLTFDKKTVEFTTANCLNTVSCFIKDYIFGESVWLCISYTGGSIDEETFCDLSEDLINRYEKLYPSSSKKSNKDTSINSVYAAISLINLCLTKYRYEAVDTHKYSLHIAGIFSYIFYIAEQNENGSDVLNQVSKCTSDICRNLLSDKMMDYCLPRLVKFRMK